MIIKTKSRKQGTGKVIRYLFKDEKKLTGEKEKHLIIRHNVRGRKEETWIKEFEENEKLRLVKRKDSVAVYHTILSFSDKDREHITEKALKQIAKEYIKQRGDDVMYVGTAHRDKEHIHLHLVESGTRYKTGKSARLSQKEFKELKLSMDAWQKEKYPELTNSLPKHGRGRETGQKEANSPRTDIRASRKTDLINSLHLAYTEAKSQEEFLYSIRDKGYTPYFRGERLTGVQGDDGRKFRFSTLGFDKEQISELGTKQSEEEKELEELRSIRSQSEEREQEEPEREFDWNYDSLADNYAEDEELKDD